jgi:hypothetical protein
MNAERMQKTIVFWSVVLMIAFLAFQNVPHVEATVMWTDDFEDGDYVGWTILNGTWSSASNYLQGTANYSTIFHESSVDYGTLTFDILKDASVSGLYYIYFMGKNIGNIGLGLFAPFDGYGLNINPSKIDLLAGVDADTGLHHGVLLGSYDHTENFDGWYTVRIIVSSNRSIKMWVDEELAVDTISVFILTELECFHVLAPENGAIDNIIVEAEDPEPTTTDPTTTEPIETTPPPVAPPPAIPMELLAVGIAVPVVLIVVVLIFRSKR